MEITVSEMRKMKERRLRRLQIKIYSTFMLQQHIIMNKVRHDG